MPNKPNILLSAQYRNLFECSRCLRPQAGEEFPDRERGKFICLTCRKELHSTRGRPEKRNEKKMAAMKVAVSELVASTTGAGIKSPHISELAAKEIESLGGMDEFCERWARQIKMLEETKPGSQVLMRSYESIARMVTESTKHRDTAPDVVDMKDDELVYELMRVAPLWLGDAIEGTVLPMEPIGTADDTARESA